MQEPARSGRDQRRGRPVAFAAALVIVLAAHNNVIVTHLPGYPASYVPVNVAAAGLLLAAARAAGLSWSDLGLAPRRLGTGVRWGGVCFAVVAVAYTAALAVPGTRPLMEDARVTGLDSGEIAYAALVRIPLGTVLWEEVAFRGVLLAAFIRLMPVRWAVVASAAVFGAWHVRPTLSAIAVNNLVHGPLLTGLLVLLACLAAVLAGVVFAVLRLRTGSLLAPALLHVATNSLGTIAAATAIRMD